MIFDWLAFEIIFAFLSFCFLIAFSIFAKKIWILFKSMVDFKFEFRKKKGKK
jgi:hypothetical protein